MLRFDGITYRIGPLTLFDGASATVNPGHRVGFVGRNGTGKTTLLGMVTGAMEPDSGSISVPSGWRIGITRQEAPDGPESLIEIVLAADEELARLNREAETATDPHRIAEIHVRLHDKGASRAQARAALNAYWLAIDDLNAAIEYAPARSDAYAFRAAAYRHLEILDLAADDVARALALAPGDPVILLESGNIRRLAGDDAGARAEWLRILIEAPESPAAEPAQANLQRLDVKQE